MATNPSISVEKRTITGRKVKSLRRDGVVPANIFGAGIDSQTIKVSDKDFQKTYNQAGETSVVDLKVKGEKKPVPVLIHNIQRDPVTDAILHIDFLQVDLTKKIATQVPIEIAGESIAVKEQGGVMLLALNEVEIEALPDDLPDQIEIDISKLEKIGDSLLVKDLKLPSKIEVLTDSETTVVLIQEQAEEEEPEAVKEEDTDAEEGEVEAETAEETESSDTESKPEKDSKETE